MEALVGRVIFFLIFVEEVALELVLVEIVVIFVVIFFG